MVRHLFRDFLYYEDQYGKARLFWSDLFERLCHESGQEGSWKLQTQEKFLDGTPIPAEDNPILNAWNERRRRAVRVAQTPPTTNDVQLAAWTSGCEYRKDGSSFYVEELTINCALSEESAAIAKELIREWITTGIGLEEMEKLIADALADVSDT